MTATREDIRQWLKEGKKKKATHVIIVCDTFDYDDYPVFVMPGEDVQEKVRPYLAGENMTMLMEAYSLTGKVDIETQIAEERAFHYD